MQYSVMKTATSLIAKFTKLVKLAETVKYCECNASAAAVSLCGSLVSYNIVCASLRTEACVVLNAMREGSQAQAQPCATTSPIVCMIKSFLLPCTVHCQSKICYSSQTEDKYKNRVRQTGQTRSGIPKYDW